MPTACSSLPLVPSAGAAGPGPASSHWAEYLLFDLSFLQQVPPPTRPPNHHLESHPTPFLPWSLSCAPNHPFLSFWLPCMACTCEILSSPKQGLNPGPSAVEVQSLHHRTAREVPLLTSNYSLIHLGFQASAHPARVVKRCAPCLCLSVSLHLLSIHPPIIIINLSSLLSIGHPSLLPL